MVKINFDLMNNYIKVDNECGRQDIVLEGPCPGTCSGCRKRVQSTDSDPRIFSGHTPHLDPDKVHAQTVEALRFRRGQIRGNDKPMPLCDYFDNLREEREKERMQK